MNSINQEDKSYNYPLYRAFRKYGIDNFSFEVLLELECDKEEILYTEKEFIINFDTVSPNGYNQTLETYCPMRDPKIAKKVSETKRVSYGKRVASINTTNDIVEIWNSVAECAEKTGLQQGKIVSVCNGKRRTTGDKIFRYLDDDNSIIQVDYNPMPQTSRVTRNSRRVAQLDISTGKDIEIFESLQIAANTLKCDSSGIAKVCNGKRKSCGGYSWRYVDSE